MRLKVLFKDQPLKRNDSLNHNRDLTISIGGTGPVSFWQPIRYLGNRLRLGISKGLNRFYSRTEYLFLDLILSNIILMAYMAGTVALPRGRSFDLSFGKIGHYLGLSIKKSIDFLGSLFGLILLMPLFLIVAILIKLDSPGPVFYTQVRTGINRRKSSRRENSCYNFADRRKRDRRRIDNFGKPFKVYKFRTMVDKAEKKCGPTWAIANDPRITRVGAFMRKTRLDELPQLINVLKGDMSLIGPRPERPVFIKELVTQVDGYENRLLVKPGITGLAQVENGYDTSVDSVKNKVAYDLQYIRKWSLWEDIKILFKTVIVVITGKGAF